VTIGNPFISGASVAAEVVDQARADKVIAFKKRRRQNSKRRRGHRQEYSMVRITEILTGGAKPSKEAKPKAAKKPRAKKQDDEAAEQPAA
jgi:large subunit ribosomal protein L21